MAKTIDNVKLVLARDFVEKHAVPMISKVVDEVNKVLSKQGIRAGAEITWLFDDVSDESIKDKK